MRRAGPRNDADVIVPTNRVALCRIRAHSVVGNRRGVDGKPEQIDFGELVVELSVEDSRAAFFRGSARGDDEMFLIA